MKKLIFTLFVLLSSIGCMWADEVTFDFVGWTFPGADSWTSSYVAHDVKYDIATVHFESADKNTSTISDCPVTKGKSISVTLNNTESYNITAIAATFKKWGSNAHTLTINTSEDGTNFVATDITSSNFAFETTTLPALTKAVKFTTSGTKQIGIQSITITVEPASSVLPPTASVASGTYFETKKVELTAEGAEIHYTLDGNDPDAQSTLYDGPISIEKTTTLKAIAIKDGESSDVVTKEYIIKVVNPVITPNTTTTYDDTQEVTITCTDADATIYYTTDGTVPTATSEVYKNSLSFTKESCIVKAIAIRGEAESDVVSVQLIWNDPTKGQIDNPYTIGEVANSLGKTAWVKGYILGSTGNGSDVSATAETSNILIGDNPEFDQCSFTAPIQLPTGNVRNALNVKQNSSNVGKEVLVYGVITTYFGCTGMKPASDYRITYPVSISAAGYSTFYVNYPAEVPAGVTAYYASAFNAGDEAYITLTPIEGVIPASTAVVVAGEEGKYNFTSNTEDKAATVSGNLLSGAATETTVEANSVLTLQNIGEVGFYTYTGTTLAPNKAWLAKQSVSSGISEVRFRIVENTTSIDAIEAPASEAKVIYNLKGQRLDTVSGKGLYIINGKKVLVK